jgi:3-oxoacyl-[acyl-carrier-protein] synthase II
LLGHASTADGAHITAPDPEGRGLELAVRAALAEAGLAPDALDMVSAHGTGTPANDRVETEVLKRVLGRRAHGVPVNSIKAHLGHTMGAAATLEAIMCLLAGRHGQVPPTLNYGEADPDCDLDCVPNAARLAATCEPVHSLGFGGCNAALVLAAGKSGVTAGPIRPARIRRRPDLGIGVVTGWGGIRLPGSSRAARAVGARDGADAVLDGDRFRRATRDAVRRRCRQGAVAMLAWPRLTWLAPERVSYM